MYVPEIFRADDRPTLYEIIRRHSFGTLVTAQGGAPTANHLPFLLDGERGVLRAHVARGNPQWRALEAGSEALAIFQGPHAYVSPSWYAGARNVPTWNYVAVHAYGTPRLLDGDATRALLGELVETHESRRSAPWTMDRLPAEFVSEMLDAIVGFEVAITRLEGKLKLNQNREPDDRAGVERQLAASDHDDARAVAEWMRRIREG